MLVARMIAQVATTRARQIGESDFEDAVKSFLDYFCDKMYGTGSEEAGRLPEWHLKLRLTFAENLSHSQFFG